VSDVSDDIANPFGSEVAAERYAGGRPDVHAGFGERIRRLLGGARVARVLDVGCGTGLSTRPLAELAARVVGLDLARPMLRQAAGGAFVQGRAEALPFRTAAFDLLTMGCAFHWCEPEATLREMRRVLAPGGRLAVYKHWFGGRMEGEPRFAAWHELYVRRFPPPPRHATFDAAQATGFVPVAAERFEHDVPLTREELVRYLTSQSNVLAALERGPATLAHVEAELHAGLAPLFGARPSAPFRFAGQLDLLRTA